MIKSKLDRLIDLLKVYTATNHTSLKELIEEIENQNLREGGTFGIPNLDARVICTLKWIAEADSPDPDIIDAMIYYFNAPNNVY